MSVAEARSRLDAAGWRLLLRYPYVLAGSACLGLAAATAGRVSGGAAVLAVVAVVVAVAVADPRGRVAALALALLLAGWWWGSARLDALDRSVLAGHVGEAAPTAVVVTGPARDNGFELRVPARIVRFGGLVVREPVLLELPVGRSPPQGAILELDQYNKAFTAHGTIMLFLFLIPVIPGVLGNFFVPLMIGAKDMAFPKLNLASFYVWAFGALFFLYQLLVGGLDTGWTLYPPYSTKYSHTNVLYAGLGIFITGFSSILTGLNIIATVHKMRCPGMTWGRLPLFVWAMYATSVIQLLGTPVLRTHTSCARH